MNFSTITNVQTFDDSTHINHVNIQSSGVPCCRPSEKLPVMPHRPKCPHAEPNGSTLSQLILGTRCAWVDGHRKKKHQTVHSQTYKLTSMTRQNMWRSPHSLLPNVIEVALLHHKTVVSDGIGAVRYGHSGWRWKVAVTTVVGVTPQSVTNNKIKVKLS